MVCYRPRGAHARKAGISPRVTCLKTPSRLDSHCWSRLNATSGFTLFVRNRQPRDHNAADERGSMTPNETLTPLEIEALRQKTRDAIDSARKVFAEKDQAEQEK